MADIRWLADLGRSDLALAGGKGANLGELTRAGFPVPPGFVVTTAGYDSYVEANGLAGALEADPAGAAAAFAAGALPGDLAEALRTAYLALGEGAATPVAVRSSATAEDLAEASFAGQQDTYLNVVGEADLLDAVRSCWASLWTERAVHYRAQHGVGAEGLSLAVVVQRMVPANAAGVMFTANPANGRTEETVITAAWGLGEAVVSGLVDTDTIVVDNVAGTVLSMHVADKAVRIDPAPAGAGERTRTSEPAAAEREAAVLDEAAALRLAALGTAIAAHFGSPQDIEWVLGDDGFQIVQARPITALPPRSGPVPQEWQLPAKGLYFRASITEQLPDPLSPLFADLVTTAVPAGVKRLMTELLGERAGRLDVGFPILNGYAFYRYGYRSFATMLGLSPTAVRMVLGGGGRWVEDRWRDRLEQYAAAVAAERAQEPGDLSGRELLAGIARLVHELAYYYTAVQTIIPVASSAELVWVSAYERLLRRPGDPAAETYLLGYDSEPIRAEKALYDLARWARGQVGLAAALRDPGTAPLAPAAPSGVPATVWQQWLERLGSHLQEHGHTLYNLDFVNPVPADDPTPVLQGLRFYLGDDAPDPYARQRRLAADREAAAAALLIRLGGRRQRWVRKLLARAQHTGPLREDALAAMGLAWPTVRRLLRELGGRLVAAGVIAEPMDVCWLTLAEARQLVAALDAGRQPELRLEERVADRRATARGQRQAQPPQYLPKNRLMDSMEWMYPARERHTGDVLSGTAGSGGVVTARARVLAGPEDFGSFQPGEVLVASITTPAYTPLFAMAAAVVTDIGGVLSHGSIVAREYGIPAVLGTGAATRRIRTGDEVTVDGTAGEVRLAGAAAAPEARTPAGSRGRWLAVAGGAAAVLAAVAVLRKRRR